jgi:hypothetical protein
MQSSRKSIKVGNSEPGIQLISIQANMKELIVYLNGGLGNQMFQYAAGRAMALSNGAALVLDTWSGFIRDYQYRRHYELDALPVQARQATAGERLPILLYRLENKLHNPYFDTNQKRMYGQFLVEKELRFLPEISTTSVSNKAWLVGYWQSPLYFEKYAATLQNELMPPAPTTEKFLELGAAIRAADSVALGVRLYEESADPAAHAREGKIKSTADINQAIERLLAQRPSAKFFVFCTHRSQALLELKLPENTVFATHDDGYVGTIERLWLLSQCRHHIITNSSYYWWGAWLSRSLNKRERQLVFAADNFINEDGICSDWERF